MNKLIIFSIFLVIKLSLVHSINWRDGNWAFGCDFLKEENNLDYVQVPGEQCGGKCASTNECTHFVFASHHNGGTCYMKKGSVTKDDAVDTGDNNLVCGIIKESSSNNEDSQTTNSPNTNPPSNSKFPGCTMKWGVDWDSNPNRDFGPWDYVTFWFGANSCDRGAHCTDFNPGWEGTYLRKMKEKNKLPVMYGYVIAFEARVRAGLYDCNDPKHPNKNEQLCGGGANWIRSNRQIIIDRYRMHGQKIAEYLGKQAEVVFIMEPDLFQYSNVDKTPQQGGGLTGEYAAQLYDDMCKALKDSLPNAKFSWDISPWGDMNRWWGYFKNSKYVDFINTSGGGHLAYNDKIDPHNSITYEFMRRLTGRKIISDSGYGVVGNAQKEENNAWYNEGNVKARIRDGVVAHTLANADRQPPSRPSTC